MQDLVEIYNSLSDPVGVGDIYAARALDDRPRVRIGRDASGNPTMLIAPRSSADPARPPIELRNLSYRPHCSCRVQGSDANSVNESLAVLKCTSDDPALRSYFLRTLSGPLQSLPAEPDEHEIRAVVMRLAELFRALEAPPQSTLQGLWCELLLITLAPRIRQAAAAWHMTPTAKHDFAAGRQRLEVKSTAGLLRAHHFSLEQLRSSDDAQVVVASFMLVEDLQGPSIRDLWDELDARSELTTDLNDRVNRILSHCLGRDWKEATEIRFDVALALRGLRLYDAADVPSVSPELPIGVSDVRFKAELTDVQHLSRGAVRRRGGLMEALFESGERWSTGLR